MKFSQMPYARPDIAQVKQSLAALTEQLKAAPDYPAAKAVFLQKEQEQKHLSTQVNLAHIRHTIDTRDAFYDGEMKFWNTARSTSSSGPWPCCKAPSGRTSPRSTAI